MVRFPDHTGRMKMMSRRKQKSLPKTQGRHPEGQRRGRKERRKMTMIGTLKYHLYTLVTSTCMVLQVHVHVCTIIYIYIKCTCVSSNRSAHFKIACALYMHMYMCISKGIHKHFCGCLITFMI